MTPHNINRERFDYLVGAGLKAGELKSFFKNKRQPLIMCGVKVQNPPADPAAAKSLVHQFSAEAHRVFGAWIQELEDEECSVAPEQWIPRYRAVEECQVQFPADDMAAIARAGLKELYKENPREDWIQFLSTPPHGNADTHEPSDSTALPGGGEWLAFGQWLCGLGTLDGVASLVLRDAAAIVAEWDRRAPRIELTTEEARRALPLVEKLIGETARTATLAPARKGLRAGAPVTRPKEEDVDYLALPVIATRVHSPRSGPYMAKVEAFVGESGPFRLEEPELREVIKTQGRVALFPDRGFGEPPPGEAVMYKVESHVTNLPVQVRAKEVLETGLLSVVRLPYSTKEAHQIRGAIEQYARTARARPAVFVTTDDLCLKPGVDSLTRVSARDYDWVLDTWENLDGLELSSGTYVLAPLPPPTGKLSCAPLAAAAVRLLRNGLRRSKANLTKAQVNFLQELLRDESLGIDDPSRERLTENIRLIAAAGEEYDELVGLLMEAPLVKADIERRVASRVAELNAEREKEIKAIAGLKSQREAMETKLEKLKFEADDKAKAIRAAVARAFARATKKEIETLGEASVLLALIGRDLHGGVRNEIAPVGADTEDPTVAVGPTVPTLLVRKVAASNGDVREVIRKFGISAETSERVSRAIRAAVSLGLPVVTNGSGARRLAENLALTLSSRDCVVCDVPIALVENARLETRLEMGDGVGVVILDANLSDFSVYAPGLLDEVLTRVLGATGTLLARPLVLSLSSGPAGLPLPAEFDELAVELNLNALSGAFVADDRAPLHPQGVLVKRVLRRLDSDPALANLDITPAVIDDLNWLLCQPATNQQ